MVWLFPSPIVLMKLATLTDASLVMLFSDLSACLLVQVALYGLGQTSVGKNLVPQIAKIFLETLYLA